MDYIQTLWSPYITIAARKKQRSKEEEGKALSLMVSKAYYAREVSSYADVETYEFKAHNVIIPKTQRSIDSLYRGVFLIVTVYNLINHWVHYSISVYPVCCCSTFAIAPIQLTLIAMSK